MDLHKSHTSAQFRVVLAFAMMAFLAILAGCLDVPDYPDSAREIEYINVYAVQKGVSDSLALKIHPSDSATLKIDVYPRQYKKELTFEWFGQGFTADTTELNSLGTGEKFGISPNTSPFFIPTKLVVRDKQGYAKTISFKVAVNSPPQMDSETKPAKGDTLYGNQSTSFLFKWNSSDPDLFDGDNLSHTLVIDGIRYNLGSILSIRQSGFSEGEHRFYVVVTDSYNDSDSISPRKFYVVDTLGRSK